MGWENRMSEFVKKTPFFIDAVKESDVFASAVERADNSFNQLKINHIMNKEKEQPWSNIEYLSTIKENLLKIGVSNDSYLIEGLEFLKGRFEKEEPLGTHVITDHIETVDDDFKGYDCKGLMVGVVKELYKGSLPKVGDTIMTSDTMIDDPEFGKLSKSEIYIYDKETKKHKFVYQAYYSKAPYGSFQTEGFVEITKAIQKRENCSCERTIEQQSNNYNR